MFFSRPTMAIQGGNGSVQRGSRDLGTPGSPIRHKSPSLRHSHNGDEDLIDHICLGRQAFEDARFHRDQEMKTRLLNTYVTSETYFDILFSTVILANIIVLIIESYLDETQVFETGNVEEVESLRSSLLVFFWLEVVFLVLYIFEFIFRIYQHRKWLKLENDAIDEEDQINAKSNPRASLISRSSRVSKFHHRKSVDEIVHKLVIETKHVGVTLSHLVEFFQTVRGVFMLIDLFTIVIGVISVCKMGPTLLASSANHVEGELDAEFFQNDLNALSALRVLRVLKLCRSFQGLRVVITGLVQATRSILWVSCFALFLILIFAIVLTNAIGKNVDFAKECSEVCGQCEVEENFYRVERHDKIV
jgi:hypothetical protein